MRKLCVITTSVFLIIFSDGAWAGEPVSGINVSLEQCCAEGMQITFGGSDIPEIPAGSFGPGSPAFNGTINLEYGESFFLRHFDVDPVSREADIRLTGLNLVSTSPVPFNGELMDVQIITKDRRTGRNPQTGKEVILHDAAIEGGTVQSAYLNLDLIIIFTRTFVFDHLFEAKHSVTVNLVQPVPWEHPAGDPTGLQYLSPLSFSSPNGDFNFLFSAVPEPAAATLIAAGLSGLLNRRTRHH